MKGGGHLQIFKIKFKITFLRPVLYRNGFENMKGKEYRVKEGVGGGEKRGEGRKVYYVKR